MQVPASMCNRHGLIAGATGTGKTKTLQLMAEQLSAIGVQSREGRANVNNVVRGAFGVRKAVIK